MKNDFYIPEKSANGYVIRNTKTIKEVYEKISSIPHRKRKCDFSTFEIARLARRNYYRMFSRFCWRLHNARLWNGQEKESWRIGRSILALSNEGSDLEYASKYYPAVEKTVYDSVSFAVMSPGANEFLDIMEQADRALYRIRRGVSNLMDVYCLFQPFVKAHNALRETIIGRKKPLLYRQGLDKRSGS